MRFENLPYFVRSLAVCLRGYGNSRVRYAGEFKEFSQFIRNARGYSPNDQQDWQKFQVLKLLRNAQYGTKHYKNIQYLKSDNLISLVKSLPLLNKKDLRDSPNDFYNRNIKPWVKSSTSGTTGSPMVVEHGKAGMQRRFALLKDHLELHGVKAFAPSIRLSGRIIADPSKNVRKPWLYVPSENQLLLSSYHLNSAHKDKIVDKFKRFCPEFMDGYSSGILETLRLLEGQHEILSNLKVIITTAETLDPRVRNEIESISGARVLDYYAASEGVPIIQQCEFSTYHVRWESGIFEVKNDEGVAFEGDGELVVTSFIQDRTPLIRYCTGDYVRGLSTFQQTKCQCGLLTPTIDGVEGRIEDIVLAKDGRKFGMFTYRTLKEIGGLGEAQVRQLDYDDFRVLGVVKQGAEPELVAKHIKNKFEQVLGYPIKFNFEKLEALPRGKNGKVRLVVSEINQS